MITIEVTPYVYRFLLKEYGLGAGPFPLTKNHDLAMAFSSIGLLAEPVPRPSHVIGRRIKLDVVNNPSAQRLVRENQHLLNSGLYFQHEFFRTMRTWVSALTDTGVAATEALSRFLAHYDISEEEYSFDSAYRQLTRKKTGQKEEIERFLVVKWSFLVVNTRNRSKTYIWENQYATQIRFNALNRATSTRHEFIQHVPQGLRGSVRTEWIASAREIIDHHLAMGASVLVPVRAIPPLTGQLALI